MELVEEGRVIEVRGRLAVDLERPRQRRVLAVELLVPPVAPAADRLREQEPRRDGVHEEAHAVARAPDDPGAGEHAEGMPPQTPRPPCHTANGPYQWSWIA